MVSLGQNEKDFSAVIPEIIIKWKQQDKTLGAFY